MSRGTFGRVLAGAAMTAALAVAAGLWWRWGEAVVLSQSLWFCAPN